MPSNLMCGLRKLLGEAGGLWEELRHARALALKRGAQDLSTMQAVAEALQTEYVAMHPWRSRVLDGAAQMLSSVVARLPRIAREQAPVAGEGCAFMHLARFREQVERHFRSHPTLAALAKPLGITPTQLNRLCRKHLHCSGLDVLHQRVLLEAKRELSYTTLQVRQISDGLGFSDPTYFTRFFRRLTGCSPKCWRERISPA